MRGNEENSTDPNYHYQNVSNQVGSLMRGTRPILNQDRVRCLGAVCEGQGKMGEGEGVKVDR